MKIEIKKDGTAKVFLEAKKLLFLMRHFLAQGHADEKKAAECDFELFLELDPKMTLGISTDGGYDFIVGGINEQAKNG